MQEGFKVSKTLYFSSFGADDQGFIVHNNEDRKRYNEIF